jgi:predicted peptidase
MKACFVLIFVLLLCAACGDGKFPETEFPSRTVEVNGQNFNYRISVPRDMRSDEKIPVMLYLHGSNRRGDDNRMQLEDIGEQIRENPERFRFIVVFPQCREDTFWAGPMVEQALAALDQTIQEFNGDKNRVYLAGYSMGGFGAWQTAITYPDKFAALVPIAAGIEPVGQVSDKDRALLSPQVSAAAAAPDSYWAYAEALSKAPVWVFHGENDEAVPVEGARKIVEAMRATGNQDVNYTEFKSVGHDTVWRAFTEPLLFDWLTKQHLNQHK